MSLPPPRLTEPIAPGDLSGAALSELEPGGLLCAYDAASRQLQPHAGPGDRDFDRWIMLHSEIMTRLAREYAARTSG